MEAEEHEHSQRYKGGGNNNGGETVEYDREADDRENELLSHHPGLVSIMEAPEDTEASTRRAEVAREHSENIAAGTVLMNGRELFLHEPWVFDNMQY